MAPVNGPAGAPRPRTPGSRYVGRVGALAVALGIGAGLAAVPVLAGADTGDGTDSRTSAVGSAARSGTDAPRLAAAGTRLARTDRGRIAGSSAAAGMRPAALGVPRAAATDADSQARAGSRASATVAAPDQSPAVAVAVTAPAPEPADDQALLGLGLAALGGGSDAPASSPQLWAALGVARRETAGRTTVVAPTAAVPAGAAIGGLDIFGRLAAFLGLPGASPSADPTIAAIPLYLRLVLDDIVGGSAPPPTADPETVITGLFRQILRVNPTADELTTYTGIWNFTGINGVVAGLYSSLDFRYAEVNNYYLEMLNREATQQELSWGATKLTWGLPEPLFAAEIGGSPEFYAWSSALGGPNGPAPSGVSFVDLLYRTLVGDTPDPVAAPSYVEQVQLGLPTGLVSTQFVTAEPFREVKVREVFSVLGLSPTPEVIADYVANWFWYGGLAGISTLNLASGENVFRIEQGLVELPDMVAAAQMQQLLLAPYDEQATGFVRLFNSLFSDPDADTNCVKTPQSCANPGLFAMLTGGGVERGLPNEAIEITTISAPVRALLPTQNEISLDSSLAFPLRNAATLKESFDGGDIKVAGRLILTAGGGQYVVDGHHRWSQLFMINPFANIMAADIGYVPAPKESLRQTQISIAAETGYFRPETAAGDNLFTIDRETFNQKVADLINQDDPLARAAVIEVFTTYLNLEGQTEEEKFVSIENYLWTNVERLRAENWYVTDATGRPLMPQTSRQTFTPVLDRMDGPSMLSYSFPIISYLG